jgi:hypothetical protein
MSILSVVIRQYKFDSKDPPKSADGKDNDVSICMRVC